MRIKRTMTAALRAMDALTGPAAPQVWYATGESYGLVTGWTRDINLAGEFDDEALARVTHKESYPIEIELEPTGETKPEATEVALAEVSRDAEQQPEPEPRSTRKGRRQRVER